MDSVWEYMYDSFHLIKKWISVVAEILKWKLSWVSKKGFLEIWGNLRYCIFIKKISPWLKLINEVILPHPNAQLFWVSVEDVNDRKTYNLRYCYSPFFMPS